MFVSLMFPPVLSVSFLSIVLPSGIQNPLDRRHECGARFVTMNMRKANLMCSISKRGASGCVKVNADHVSKCLPAKEVGRG